MEGLFAGYKPLFLGNGATETNRQAELEELQEILYDTRDLNPGEDEKIIPWDASVGGLLYNDESFKNVPRDVVNKLRFFQPLKDNKDSATTGSAKSRKPRYINFRVHNPIVDEGLFDNYQAIARKNKKNGKKKSKLAPATVLGAVNSNGNSIIEDDLAYDHHSGDHFMSLLYANELNAEFIREKELLLQYTINNFKIKLNNELKAKYHTELMSKTPVYKLPRYIFFQRKSIANELLFKKKLHKIFLKESHILYQMLYGYRETDYNKKRFRKSYLRNIRRLVASLSRRIYVNVDNFNLADALVLKQRNNQHQQNDNNGLINKSSGTQNNNNAETSSSFFGRIYWFNPKRRFDMIVKRKTETNFHKYQYFSYYPINTKSSIMTPLTLICKHGDDDPGVLKESINDVSENENESSSDISNDQRG